MLALTDPHSRLSRRLSQLPARSPGCRCRSARSHHTAIIPHTNQFQLQTITIISKCWISVNLVVSMIFNSYIWTNAISTSSDSTNTRGVTDLQLGQTGWCRSGRSSDVRRPLEHSWRAMQMCTRVPLQRRQRVLMTTVRPW
jgi:hypothetical protein